LANSLGGTRGLEEIHELQAVQDFMREVVLTSNHPQKVREFFSTFVEQIVVRKDTVEVDYRKDRLVAVHSEPDWLPDLGSNQGPAD
jgi:hypothetical protein